MVDGQVLALHFRRLRAKMLLIWTNFQNFLLEHYTLPDRSFVLLIFISMLQLALTYIYSRIIVASEILIKTLSLRFLTNYLSLFL